MHYKPRKIYLYLGIAIPSGFLLLFLLLSFIGTFIAPPQNEVIFAEKHYGLDISIQNNKINIIQKTEHYVDNLPNIIRFNPITKQTTKYKVKSLKRKNAIVYYIPDFPKHLKINQNKTSKDGYRFVCNNNDYLFFILNKDNNCVLHKWIKNTPVEQSSYHSLFLGWIENE